MLGTMRIRERFAKATATLCEDDRDAVNALLVRAYQMGVSDASGSSKTSKGCSHDMDAVDEYVGYLRSFANSDEYVGYLKGRAVGYIMASDKAGAVKCVEKAAEYVDRLREVLDER